MKWGFILFLAASLCAQAPPPSSPAANASISGVVRDKNTGTPLKDYTVSTYVNATFGDNSITMSPTTKEINSKTDAGGRYALRDLPPGRYRLQATGPEGFLAGNLSRNVTLGGQDLEGINFDFVVPGVITGRIVDENKDPLPDMMVRLVTKEYFQGSLGYYFGSSSRTDDLGNFIIENVTPGRTYYLVADYFRIQAPVHADTPLNSKMRRRIPMRTWYPSSPDKEGAAPILLRPGERREGVNLEVKKSPSYCLSGIALTPNGRASLNVSVEQMTPSSGINSRGGGYYTTLNANTADDGEFRLCDFAPASYRVTVREKEYTPQATLGISTITISDQDLTDLRLTTAPRVSLDTQVVLEGTPPQTPLTVKARINMRPMFRTQMQGEKTFAQPEIPGTAQLTGLVYDDFAVDTTVNAPGLYVKEVTYGGRNVMNEPLRLGTSQDSTIRVVIAQDGGTISVKVAGRNGAAVPGSNVIVMPQGAASEAALAARIVSGQTDQSGAWKSPVLRPGKYYVVATEDTYDVTPESIGSLWQSHNRYEEVNLEPKGAAQLTLQPQSTR